MTTEFTPGPWKATCYPRACYFKGKYQDGWYIDGPECVPDYECPMFQKADARLIAAAPDLYEAVERLLKNGLFWLDGGHNEDVNFARAALKEARGEA